MFLNISLRKYYGTKQESKLNNYKCLPRMLVGFRFNLKQRKGVFFITIHALQNTDVYTN